MSSTKHLLEPELQVMADAPFIPELTDDNISKARDNMAAKAVGLADPSSHNVQRSEIFVSQSDGPDVRCLLYQPKLMQITIEQDIYTFMEAVICLALLKDLTFQIC